MELEVESHGGEAWVEAWVEAWAEAWVEVWVEATGTGIVGGRHGRRHVLSMGGSMSAGRCFESEIIGLPFIAVTAAAPPGLA